LADKARPVRATGFTTDGGGDALLTTRDATDEDGTFHCCVFKKTMAIPAFLVVSIVCVASVIEWKFVHFVGLGRCDERCAGKRLGRGADGVVVIC